MFSRNARQNYYFFLKHTRYYLKKRRKTVFFLAYVTYFEYFCILKSKFVQKETAVGACVHI